MDTNLIKFVALIGFLGLIAGGVSAKPFVFSNSKLACPGITIQTLQEIKQDEKHVCNSLVGGKYTSVEPWDRVGRVSKCLCSLLPQTLLWQSIVDRDVAEMYKTLDDILGGGSIYREATMLEKLDKIAREYSAVEFRKLFIQSRTYIIAKNDKFLSTVCPIMKNKFGVYWDFIFEVAKAAENPELLYEIPAYDKNFFKSLMVLKGCEYLGELS